MGAVLTVGLLAGGGAVLFALPAQAATTATTCAPKSVTRVTAPGVGNTYVATAASAGSVTLLQNATSNLEVSSVAPASGWNDTVVTASGVTVHVSFQQPSSHANQVRFHARVNSTGTEISLITVVCT